MKNSMSENHLTRTPTARPQQAVIWSENLWVDMHYQTETITSMYVVETPRCLPARGYRWLGYSVPEPREDAGQQEAAR